MSDQLNNILTHRLFSYIIGLDIDPEWNVLIVDETNSTLFVIILMIITLYSCTESLHVGKEAYSNIRNFKFIFPIIGDDKIISWILYEQKNSTLFTRFMMVFIVY